MNEIEADKKCVIKTEEHTKYLNPYFTCTFLQNKENFKFGKLYECQQCPNFQTHSIIVLLKHQNVNCRITRKTLKSATVCHQCPQCPFKTKNRHYMKYHRRRKHPREDDEWFFCSQCSFKGATIWSLRNHQRVHLAPEEIQWIHCNKCPYKARNNSLFKRHVMCNHTDPALIKWYNCEFCSYKTKQTAHLKKHNKYKHMVPQVRLKSEHCPTKPHSKTELTSHDIRAKYATLQESDYFKCELCSYKTIDRGTLNRHKKSIHMGIVPEKKFQCEKCGFVTTSKGNLSSHMLCKHTTPENIQWFQCDQCAFKAKMKSQLKMHITLRHAEVVWHKCELCEYQAKQKCHVARHVKARHAEKKDLKMLTCCHCAYSTPFKFRLNKHISVKHKEILAK